MLSRQACLLHSRPGRCGATSAWCCGTGNTGRLVYSRTYLVHSQTPREDGGRGHRGLRRGQTHPKTANRFRVRSNLANVMQVDHRPVISTLPRKNPEHFYHQLQWTGRTFFVVLFPLVVTVFAFLGWCVSSSSTSSCSVAFSLRGTTDVLPLVPVQRQSVELPATTVGEWRRRHSL